MAKELNINIHEWEIEDALDLVAAINKRQY